MINLEEFDERVDVWAAGIIFYFMLSNQHPFANGFNELSVDESSILEKNPEMDKDLHNISSFTKNLIMHLLEKNYYKRYTAKQALKSKWIFTYWGQHKKAVLDSFHLERKHWFDDGINEDQTFVVKSKKRSYHPDDDSHIVDFIIKRRNPYDTDTFLSGKQSVFDPDRHKQLIDKINLLRKPKSYFEKYSPKN